MTTLAMGQLSPSTQLAIDWAWVAARHRAIPHAGGGTGGPNRTTEPKIGPADLLVGTLLAHPDEDGECRVLLHHFGLTARDVLPASYPKLPIQDLRREAQGINPGDPHPLDEEAESVLTSAASLAGGRVSLPYLLAALLAVDVPLRWRTSLAARGADAARVRDSYNRWLEAERKGGGTEVGGRRLRRWLERENPRRPVDLPQYAPDRIDSRQDHIGVATEAEAFARLIASCDMSPPLAIALFGDWGSGKSFLMSAVRDRLEALTARVADRPQDEVRVWKRIKQIDFNAWEYVQGNLWASLLENIFAQLGSMQLQLVDSWRAPVKEQLAAARAEVEGGEKKVATARAEVDTLEEKVTQAQQAAETAGQQAAAAAAYERRRQAEQQAHKALRQFWGQVPEALAGQSGADLVDAVRQARAELEQGRALTAYWKDWRHVARVSLGVLVAPIIAVLLALVPKISAEWAAFGGLVTLVPVITVTLRAATRWSGAMAKELRSAEAAVQERLDAPVADAQRALDEAREAAATAREDLARAEEDLRLSQLHSADLDNELNSLTPGRILVNFADRRTTEYGRRLGLLGQVRKDLGDLEGSILDNNRRLLAGEVPAEEADVEDVPNRIVLYIDDLDRCPPAKVVEVLEAVHLLLAFELFVVVVAVDSRWLTSALIDRLVALQPRPAEPDQPTTHDYLEKIFQLPFWVQPRASDGRKALVHGLLRRSVRVPDQDMEPDRGNGSGGLRVGAVQEELAEKMLLTFGTEIRPDTSPLVLEPADLALFESLAPLLGDTPRRVKRFVNICQLLYAMTPPLTSGPGVDSERARVALLSAICDSSSGVAGRLLDGIEATRPQPGAPVTAPNREPVTLSGFVDGLDSTCDRLERERLTGWLRGHPDWGAVPLAQFDVRLDMVRRLRFDKPVRVANP
jgi:hypothetical protein